MTLTEFIFGIIIAVVLLIAFIGYIGIKYDYQRLTDENEKLKAEILRIKIRKAKKKDVK